MAKKNLGLFFTLLISLLALSGFLYLLIARDIAERRRVEAHVGHLSEALVREALECGAYDYVTKPFNLEYLETVVLTKVLLGRESSPG